MVHTVPVLRCLPHTHIHIVLLPLAADSGQKGWQICTVFTLKKAYQSRLNTAYHSSHARCLDSQIVSLLHQRESLPPWSPCSVSTIPLGTVHVCRDAPWQPRPAVFSLCTDGHDSHVLLGIFHISSLYSSTPIRSPGHSGIGPNYALSSGVGGQVTHIVHSPQTATCSLPVAQNAVSPWALACFMDSRIWWIKCTTRASHHLHHLLYPHPHP